MFKLPTLTLITVAGLLVATAEISHAAVVNGSFETGNFSDWNTSGQASVETSSFQVTPVNGSYQAVLQTCFFTGACDDSQSLTNANDLESFLGLSVNELSNLGVIEGSAIKQTITANAGDDPRHGRVGPGAGRAMGHGERTQGLETPPAGLRI